jgi:Flp pilus assembly pilin Flp
MGNAILSLWRQRTGTTSIEYALIASLIAVAIFASVAAIATPLNATFTNLASHI